MGLAWYISAEREVAGLNTFVDGKAIAHADEKWLTGIMKKLNIKPIMDFFSANPEELADLFGDFGEETGEMPTMPEEEWFSAEEGLATIKPLLDYLGKHKGEVENQDYIVRDLEEYQRILEVLATEGVGWHLSIDI